MTDTFKILLQYFVKAPFGSSYSLLCSRVDIFNPCTSGFRLFVPLFLTHLFNLSEIAWKANLTELLLYSRWQSLYFSSMPANLSWINTYQLSWLNLLWLCQSESLPESESGVFVIWLKDYGQCQPIPLFYQYVTGATEIMSEGSAS